MKNKSLCVFSVLFLFVILLDISIKDVERYNQILELVNNSKNHECNSFPTYWACMDGCSNMQELVYGKEFVYAGDELWGNMKDLHNKCSKICNQQYNVD